MAAWLLGSILAAAVPGDSRACGPVSDCIVEQGSYRALPPPGWDGRSPLPTTVFFHGYQGSGADMLADARIARPLAAQGFLLVAPDGLGKSWSHQGSPSQLRDEHRFVDAVLADVASRWPIDRSRLLAAGFSQGGSMVWDLACLHPAGFRAFVAISGSFWDPPPVDCAQPVDLLHLHGLVDEIVPLEGRAIRQQFHQGDVFAGMELLRRTDGCRRQPQVMRHEGTLVCRAWTGCASGHGLELCLFDGSHEIPANWLDTTLRWLGQLGS